MIIQMKRSTDVAIATSLFLTMIFVYWLILRSSYSNSNEFVNVEIGSVQKAFYECENFNKVHSSAFWKQANYEQLSIPYEVIRYAVSVVVESHRIKVNEINLHFRESRPQNPDHSNISVFFLHGGAFSSATWEDLGTLSLVSAFGFRAIALDLPGFGKSSRAAIPHKGKFLSDVIVALKLQKPVIVSPSMSGVFSIPYVIEYWQNISGYVPVSPVIPAISTASSCKQGMFSMDIIVDDTCNDLLKYKNVNKDERFSCVKIPVMVIHGQHDQGESSARMCHFPWSRGVEIPDGQHAAYMTKPAFWHRLLYNFLNIVNKTQTCR